MNNKRQLASLAITLSTLVIAIKLLAPSSLQIIILGGTIIYLLNDNVTKSTLNLDKLLEKTSDQDEQTLLKLLIDSEGTIFQGEIVEQTGFSKSKVSLLLDRLEARKIIERKRHGMSNIVVLK